MGYKKIDDLCLLGLFFVETCRLFFNHIQFHRQTLESITFTHEYLVTFKVQWEELYRPNGSILLHVCHRALQEYGE